MKRKPSDDEGAGFPPWDSDVKPAPGELRVVQAFVNTANRVKGTDELDSPEALVDWLERWKLWQGPAAAPTAADLEWALAAREALRALIGADTRGVEADAGTVEQLDRTAAQALLRVRFGAGGWIRLEPAADGLAGALGRLFAIVSQERRGDLWRRFKLCANVECLNAFFDDSPNASGKWCDAKRRCGNRLNMRRFIRRHPKYYKYRTLGRREGR